MNDLKTIEFIREHANWRELLSEDPYNLKIKEDNNYILLAYSQVKSDFNYEICRECRGLIIDKNTITPAALSFYKFFNVQETHADNINWNNCRVQEKVDGSKILVWWDKYLNNWRISTSGMLDAFEAKAGDFGNTFGDLFMQAWNKQMAKINIEQCLHQDYCYTFELVSPETRVVIPYKELDIYLIGVRNVKTFEEELPVRHSINTFIKTPKTYFLNTLDECLFAVNNMGFDEEGFVVVDDNWNRVKIKSPAYVAVHHMKDNGKVNKHRFLELINRNETSEFLSYFPEYTRYIDELKEARSNLLNDLVKGCITINDKFKLEEDKTNICRKDYALLINKDYSNISSFLFKFLNEIIRNGEIWINDFIKEQWDNLTTEKQLEYLKYYIKEGKTSNE